MTLARKRYLALALVSLIAACGNSENRGEVGKQAAAMLKARIGKSEAQAPPTREQLRAAITPEFREQTGNVPLLLVSSIRVPVTSIMTRFAVNGDVETYLTPDQISFSLKSGILISSRGLGNDLVSANIDGVLPRIQAGSGRAVRVHRYLNGENQEIQHRFDCTYTHPETEVIESCEGVNMAFTNRYGLDPSGRIIKSVQWVSPGLKHYLIESIQ